MAAVDPQSVPGQEQPFISHLLELRDRLLRIVVAVFLVFLALFPFANELYIYVATPLMERLPEGNSMIATEVASPFLTPFKLTLVAAVFLTMPFLLYQFWAFVAPGLYRHEKRLAVPLLVSSVVLFYTGMVFAYYVVFPLVFAFLTGTAPEGVAVMTDISRYLDFVLTLFFAFGLAFEIPIATFVLVLMGVTTPDALASKRPYIIVGVFVVGMLLTPPDVISQTLLALPMWLLFEAGVFFSRMFAYRLRSDQEADAGMSAAAAMDSPTPDRPNPGPVVGSEISGASSGHSDRFVPMTEAEMDAELDAIEAEEDESDAEADSAAPPSDPVQQKLHQVQELRDRGDEAGARTLLYEVLAEGDADQRRVAQNVLEQLDTP